jgi:hypothetical protein
MPAKERQCIGTKGSVEMSYTSNPLGSQYGDNIGAQQAKQQLDNMVQGQLTHQQIQDKLTSGKNKITNNPTAVAALNTAIANAATKKADAKAVNVTKATDRSIAKFVLDPSANYQIRMTKNGTDQPAFNCTAGNDIAAQLDLVAAMTKYPDLALTLYKKVSGVWTKI